MNRFYFYTSWMFVINIFISQTCYASLFEIESYEFQQTQDAQSLSELNKVREWVEDIKIEIRACEIQKKDNLLPTSCFQAVNKAQNLKIELGRDFKVAHLKSLCLKIAAQTTESTLPAVSSLPQDCFEKATAKIRVNQYKRGIDIE